VTVRTADGATLAATYFEPGDRPAPAVLLLHMLTRSRNDWEVLGRRLADEGIAALALDFRGHGDSARLAPGVPDDLTVLLQDVTAGIRFLQGRHDVRHAHIGIAGASLGATLAALAGAADPAIRSIALLSPGLEYRGLRLDAAMRKYGARPVLLVASSEDTYAVRSARQIGTAQDPARELRVLEGAGHGTTMLSRAPDLVRGLVEWFARTLG
jgi:alpha-beta hydrolase superfamily lysophospholipase